MSTGAELLRLLNSTASPVATGAAPSTPPSGIDFASLLQKAGAGELESGLPVSVARGVPVQLSPQQLSRIAAAADKAQAQGATRALVLIDGKALTLDVAVRQVTGQADMTSAGVFTGVDAVINIPSNGTASAPAARAVPLPRSGYASPSLLRMLGRTEDPAA